LFDNLVKRPKGLERFPLVSVLMTAYNRSDFIAEAIESVLNSSYSNFELIIVDDCSTDNTVEIARQYAERDSRIKVYVNERNLGDYPNRNVAANYAVGEFIKFLDSDDTIMDWGLEYCVQAMLTHPQARWASYSPFPVGSEQPLMFSSSQIIRSHFFQHQHLCVGPSGTIYNRDFFRKLGLFDTRFGVSSDGYMHIRMAIESPVVILPRLFIYYRMHDNQEKNNAAGYLVNNYLFLRELLDTHSLPLSAPETEFLRRKMQKRHAVNLVKFFSQKKNLTATLKIMKATSFSPYALFLSLFK
jgi:glycosyltransferase involved in cell wall biosynthesis